MDDLNRRILEIPEEKIRLTNSGRLDFPVIPKLCIGRDCFKKNKMLGGYSGYDKSENCKSCLWYLLQKRRFHTPVVISNDLEWIKRNQKFEVCRVGVVTYYNPSAWLRGIDYLRDETYKKMLPDIVRAYEVC